MPEMILRGLMASRCRRLRRIAVSVGRSDGQPVRTDLACGSPESASTGQGALLTAHASCETIGRRSDTVFSS
jgi:hypothetical protein